jgi:hypothetical protein
MPDEFKEFPEEFLLDDPEEEADEEETDEEEADEEADEEDL